MFIQAEASERLSEERRNHETELAVVREEEKRLAQVNKKFGKMLKISFFNTCQVCHFKYFTIYDNFFVLKQLLSA